jgi:polycystin 1L2
LTHGIIYSFLNFFKNKDSCQQSFQTEAVKNISAICLYPPQDNANYGFGWSQLDPTFTPPNGYQSLYAAFQYKTAEDLKGSPIEGIYGTYDGSGYLYEMRGKLSYIQGNLSLLKQMNWVDRQTRAVLVEFSAYNPNIGLVMVSTILIEFLSSGSLLTKANFEPLNLFSESGGIVSFKVMSELIFVAFIVYYLVIEIREMLNMDIKEYLSEFWSYIEWSIIITAFISCVMILVRLRAAQVVLDFFKQTAGYGYMKLQNVNETNQILTYSLGLCATLGTIKFLKMLRFNRNIAYLAMTLKFCFHELVFSCMAFFLIWIAFVQLMYLIYNNNLNEYASLSKSMGSAFQTILGKFDAKQFLFGSSTILGPFVFASYNIVMLTFVMNIFVSIITDSFDKIRHECKDHPEKYDVDIFKYLYLKWRELLLKRNSKRKPFVGRNDYNEDYINNFHIQTNRLIDMLAEVIFYSDLASNSCFYREKVFLIQTGKNFNSLFESHR